MTAFRLLAVLALVALARPAMAFEPCSFTFRIDTQSSAFQALVDGAAARGGFWRPIREAPDDVQEIGRYIGRLDTCLMTPDGNPRTINLNGQSVTLRSPHIASCTAALLPGNRLLTNHHCYYNEVLRTAGFSIVQEARINFGYVSADFTDDVQTFLVSPRELAVDEALDVLVLQIIGGDANAVVGGHVPMVMDTEVTPRRALTMVHHPGGDPQQFSSGTCQVHPEQASLPDSASQLRHSCETTGGSSGALLLDARTLAVVGLHNQGGLDARGGYNGGHKIAMIEAALDLGFEARAATGAGDPEARAQAALVDALARTTGPEQRRALEAIAQDFAGTRAAEGAARLLSSIVPAPRALATDGPVLTVRQDGSGDFASVVAAVASASAGDTIHIFPGTYRGGVDVDKPLNFIGMGPRDGIVLEANEDDVFYWTAREGRIENLSLRLEGGSFYGIDFHGGSAVVTGIDITSQGLATIAIRDGGDPLIRDSVIRDSAQSGLYVYDNGRGTIEDSEIFGTALAAVSITGGGDPTIRDTIIRDGAESGVYVYEGGRGTIESNEIHGHARSGVGISEGGDPTIRDNIVRDNLQSGVYVFDGGFGTISGNEIAGNALSGVAVSGGGDPTVRDNLIRDGQQSGVHVYEEGLGTFEANEITGNGGAGFVVQEESDPLVQGNTITGNAYEAIWVKNGGKGRFIDNDLRGNARGAYDIEASAGAVVREGNLE